jgi:hypothetical protein
MARTAIPVPRRRAIFLDIDGVLNARGFCGAPPRELGGWARGAVAPPA